jgi:hypothetical protein
MVKDWLGLLGESTSWRAIFWTINNWWLNMWVTQCQTNKQERCWPRKLYSLLASLGRKETRGSSAATSLHHAPPCQRWNYKLPYENLWTLSFWVYYFWRVTTWCKLFNFFAQALTRKHFASIKKKLTDGVIRFVYITCWKESSQRMAISVN